jgi:hypothetical protein
MTYDHPGDPTRRAAEYEAHQRRILDDHRRAVRRHASIGIALSVPALAAILAASFPLLSRTRVTDRGAVVAVCMLGGLLAGLFLCVRTIVTSSRIRHPKDELPGGGLLVTIALLPLVAGAVAGFVAALCVLGLAGGRSYRPQTLYVISVALAAYAAARVSWLT